MYAFNTEPMPTMNEVKCNFISKLGFTEWIFLDGISKFNDQETQNCTLLVCNWQVKDINNQFFRSTH